MSRNVNDKKCELDKKSIGSKIAGNSEKSNVNDSINHILIKPIVKIEINLEEFEAECSSMLCKPQKHN